MAKVEVEETDLVNFQAVSGTMAALLANPATRQTVLKAVKTVKPTAVIPEIDAAAPVLAELGAVTKLVTDLRADLTKDKTDREEAARLADLRAEWAAGQAVLRGQGYTSAAITAIEAIMEKEGIRSHEIAANHWSKLNPPDTAISGSNRFDIFSEAARKDDGFLNSLFETNGQSEGALNDQINQALRNARTGQAA